MKTLEQTIQQVGRFLNKISEKFPESEDTCIMTDVHLRVSQDSGEMLAFDDDDKEITRCVIEEWIENKDEDFYGQITKLLRTEIENCSEKTGNLGILKPYSFVLENDDCEHIAELYVADDDTIIIGGDLMEGLESDLDNFFANLFEEN